MILELTDRQKLIRRSVRNFAEDILAPKAAIFDKEAKFDWNIAKKLSEIDAWGIQLPEKFGGADLDSVSYAIIIEEISRTCASTGLTLTVHNSVGAFPIYKWGTEEQKEKYLYDIAKGQKIAGFTWTEPNAGSDAQGIECMAKQDGDDFILNGSKIFVTNGGIGSVFLVGTRYQTIEGRKGVATVILEKEMDGFEVGQPEEKMGMRGNITTSLYFHNIRVPKENILGSLDDGFQIAMQTLDVGRIGIAAQALGIAQAAYEHSVEYSKGRIQFKRPISRFQGVSFKLADMATKIDAARLLIYRAAYIKDKKKRFSKESAMCKLYASEIAKDITKEAIQIHGGYGYMKDLPVERYHRDACVTSIYEGTSEIMKLIIAQQILKGNL
ncbi:MAG: acyl-CoA dehydrogenase [Candidatus Lokiarchaeota archaeon]|nr:acyl-CoA dehydrogenase [Candidatus Lokiarchaeota archaeon]MBD3342646.1 acyl-CoA dehydrogenase [Candidatus Lokiarchaeota archaeon]